MLTPIDKDLGEAVQLLRRAAAKVAVLIQADSTDDADRRRFAIAIDQIACATINVIGVPSDVMSYPVR